MLQSQNDQHNQNTDDNRMSQYTFKNKKDDLNERINSFGRTATVQTPFPIQKHNPYLDMRPQNTSDMDYEQTHF